jgi:multicomponent Na+:H+ antiporter subunit G
MMDFSAGFTLVRQLLAVLAILIGTSFSILGVLGFIRMPDVYTRLHATGKVGVFGVVLLTIAAVNLDLIGFGKGLILIVILLFTGPVISHAVSSAAYRIGIPMQGVLRDDIAQHEAEEA